MVEPSETNPKKDEKAGTRPPTPPGKGERRPDETVPDVLFGGPSPEKEGEPSGRTVEEADVKPRSFAPSGPTPGPRAGDDPGADFAVGMSDPGFQDAMTMSDASPLGGTGAPDPARAGDPGDPDFQAAMTMADAPSTGTPPRRAPLFPGLPMDPPPASAPGIPHGDSSTADPSPQDPNFQAAMTMAEMPASGTPPRRAPLFPGMPGAPPPASAPGIPHGDSSAADPSPQDPNFQAAMTMPEMPVARTPAPPIPPGRRPSGFQPNLPKVPEKSDSAGLAPHEPTVMDPPGAAAAAPSVAGGPRSAVDQTRHSPKGDSRKGDSQLAVSKVSPAATSKADSSVDRSRAGVTTIASRAGLDVRQIEQIKATGQRFADYYLVQKLGQGGMGAVYKAYDPKLNRYVAIKVLTAASGDPDLLQARFWREGRASAKLRHPGIVAVYDIGMYGDTPYLVMDYVEGKSLDKVVRAPKDDLFPKGARTRDGRPGGLEVAVAIKLANEICRAMDYAHSQGIVHRDIKPANILIDLETKKPVITDFGLAKDLTESEQRLTKSGATLGTVLYMAPEQAAGDQSKVGPRSDIYALGAMLYELLTGRPPLEGGETIQLIQRVLNEDPRQPSAVVPTLDRQLDILCMKALEKDPDRRYPTAGEMAEDLWRIMKGEHILAHAPSIDYKIKRFVKRKRTPILLGAAVVAALGVAGYFVMQTEWAKQRASYLEAALTGKKEAEDRRNRALARLADAQAAFNQLVVASRQGDARSLPTGLQRVTEHVRGTLEIEDLREARVLEASAFRWAGQRDPAIAALDALLTAHPDFPAARLERARVRLDEYAERLSAARLAAVTAERLLEDPPGPLAAWTGSAAWEKADAGLTALRLQAAEDLAKIQAWPEEPALLELSRALAGTLRDGADGTAGAALEKAVAAVESADEGWWALARLALDDGRPQEALVALAELHKRHSALPSVPRDRFIAALARALTTEPAAEGADRVFQRTRDELDALVARDSAFPGTAIVRGWTARLLFETGRSPADRALPLLEETLAAWKDVASTPAVELFRARSWSDLADLHLAAGRVEAALPALQETLTALAKADPQAADADLLDRRAGLLSRVAESQRALGKDARESYRSAIALYDTLLTRQADDTALTRARGIAWHDLGQALADQKEDSTPAFEKGFADLSRALDRSPADKDARRMRIRCLAGMSGQYSQAGKEAEKFKYADLMRADCEAALADFPEDAELYKLLANAEGTLAFWFDIPQDLRSSYYARAQEHYQQAIDRGVKDAWHSLGMLYVAMGGAEKALHAFRRYRSVVPHENPELDKLMEGLEAGLQRATLTRDLDAANDLTLNQKYLEAEKAFEQAFHKLYGYFKLCTPEEVEKILRENGSRIAISHYNLACVYAQASAGKAGSQTRPAVVADQKKAYQDLAFEELEKAAELNWGKELDPSGKIVPSARTRDQTEKDTDLAPLHGDPRWKKFLERMAK